jgi:hypothetical protein
VVNQDFATLKPTLATSTLQNKRSRSHQISGRGAMLLHATTKCFQRKKVGSLNGFGALKIISISKRNDDDPLA